jgi:toxin ParE1/3/4
MKRVVQRRERARQDLVGIARYYAKEAGPEIARRFLKQAEETFGRLASSAGIGRRYKAQHSEFPPIRFFPIALFRKYLIFYLPTSDSIQIVRVLHSARDLDSILDQEFGVEAEDEAMPEE